MNWKVVVIGGILFYIVTFALGFATGPLLHDGLLKPTYREHSEFWRPELNQEPPDMGPLMPRWITTGVIWALVVAALWDKARGCFSGPYWRRGLTGGLYLAVLYAAVLFQWSGVFDLPDKLWLWWSLEGFLYYLVGGAVLGWVTGKLAPGT
jgi:hypothetical protein